MARRARGEGSIYQRADDGRWIGVLALGDVNGRRRRRYLTGKTQREVRDKLLAARHAQSKGLPMETPARLTVGAFLDRWLATSATHRLRPRTLQSYMGIVEGWLKPALGRRPLIQLQPEHVQCDLINRMAAAGRSPYTIRNARAVLRRALTEAESWGLISRNVAKLVTLPRIPTQEVEPFTPEDAGRFLEAVREERHALLYRLALSLGMRQGEILGLSWGAVDFDAETLEVRKVLVRYGGAYHHDEPKTPKSRRLIEIPAALAAGLRDHKVRQLEERLRAGPAWIGNDFDLVFARENGLPISTGSLIKQFRAALQRAGLPRCRFHDLRHSSASFMLAEGVPIEVISEVLGHADSTITSRVYAHVSPGLRRDATERVDALLRRSL